MNTILINDSLFHYHKSGKGKPIVLVHGNGEDHTIFQTEIEQLVSAGYCVFAPDSRGHGATGASNPPVSEFHYADMADDIYLIGKGGKHGLIHGILTNDMVDREGGFLPLSP